MPRLDAMREAGRVVAHALAAVREAAAMGVSPARARRGGPRGPDRGRGALPVPRLPAALRPDPVPGGDLRVRQRRRRARHPRPTTGCATATWSASTAAPTRRLGRRRGHQLHRRNSPPRRPGTHRRHRAGAGRRDRRRHRRQPHRRHLPRHRHRRPRRRLRHAHRLRRPRHRPHACTRTRTSPTTGRPGRGFPLRPGPGHRHRAHAHGRRARRLPHRRRRLDPAHDRRQPGRPHRAHHRRSPRTAPAS